MTLLLILLCAYGLCFWVQNKLKFLKGKHSFLDALIKCSYCLGFHCGWFSYCMVTLSHGESPLWYIFIVQAIIHGFAGAVFCYFFDELALLIESKK